MLWALNNIIVAVIALALLLGACSTFQLKVSDLMIETQQEKAEEEEQEQPQPGGI